MTNIEEKIAHIVRWKEEGVGTIAEIHNKLKAISHKDIVKVCNQETRRHTKLKCKQLLDTIQHPENQKAKEEELKRELVDMLVYERLEYIETGDGIGPECSPIDIVKESGLPSNVVDRIVNNPGWYYWFDKNPIA